MRLIKRRFGWGTLYHGTSLVKVNGWSRIAPVLGPSRENKGKGRLPRLGPAKTCSNLEDLKCRRKCQGARIRNSILDLGVCLSGAKTRNWNTQIKV